MREDKYADEDGIYWLKGSESPFSISHSQIPFSKPLRYLEAQKTLCKSWKDAFTLTGKAPTAICSVRQEEMGHRISLPSPAHLQSLLGRTLANTLLELGLLQLYTLIEPAPFLQRTHPVLQLGTHWIGLWLPLE